MSDAFGYGGGYVPKYQQQDPMGMGAPTGPSQGGYKDMSMLPGLPMQRDPVSGGPDMMNAKMATQMPQGPATAPRKMFQDPGDIGSSYMNLDFSPEAKELGTQEWFQKYAKSDPKLGGQYLVDPLESFRRFGLQADPDAIRRMSEESAWGAQQQSGLTRHGKKRQVRSGRLTSGDILSQTQGMTEQDLKDLVQREGGFRGVQGQFQESMDRLAGLHSFKSRGGGSEAMGYNMQAPVPGRFGPGDQETLGYGARLGDSSHHGVLYGATNVGLDPKRENLQEAYNQLARQMESRGYL